jgi:hypothetical protein
MDHDFPKFIAVVEICSTVAMDTHTKYGTWAMTTNLYNFQTATTH